MCASETLLVETLRCLLELLFFFIWRTQTATEACMSGDGGCLLCAYYRKNTRIVLRIIIYHLNTTLNYTAMRTLMIEESWMDDVQLRRGTLTSTHCAFCGMRMVKKKKKKKKVSGLCYRSISEAHLSDQFDLRDNIVRFHLIPQFDLENCIGSKTVPNPLPLRPHPQSADARDRHSSIMSSGIDTLAALGWGWEHDRERLGMEKGEEQK